MKVHANAALGPKGRLTMARRVVEQGWSVTEAAAAAGVSDLTCSKWVVRYRCEGKAGLVDRSSAPRTVADATGRTLPATEPNSRILAQPDAIRAACHAEGRGFESLQPYAQNPR
jgi:transposase-like protein